MEEEKKVENKNKILKNIFFGIGIVSIILAVLSTIVKTLEITQSAQYSPDIIVQYIPAIVLLFLGHIFITLGKELNSFFKLAGKSMITLCAFFLSAAIITGSFYIYSEELVQDIQPSLDHLIIEYISSQEGLEFQILQDLLNETVDFQTFSATKLKQDQKKYLIDSFEINTIEELSEEEIEELPSKIISTIYESLLQQNQTSIINSPIPIAQIITFLKSGGNLELTLVTMSYLYDANENASLLLMIPSQNQLESSTENLNHIREQCSTLEQNQVCDAFSLSEYNNLINYIQENETLPIEIDARTIESINSIEKLENNIEDKFSLYVEFILASVLFLLLGYYFLEKHYKKKEKEHYSYTHTIKNISKQLGKYFIIPTILLSIIILVLKSSFVKESINTLFLGVGLNIAEIVFNSPIILTLNNIIITLLIIHCSILLITCIIYFIIKDK